MLKTASTKQRRLAALATLATLSLTLVACTAQGGGDADASANSTFTFVDDNIAANLDPALASGAPELQYSKATYETLVNYDPEKKELTPGLATEWKVADSGQEVELILRDNVKFHDDSDLTAEGVVTSLRRTLEIGKGESYLLGNVAELSTGAENTVIVTLKEKDPQFIYSLTRIFIVSAEAIDEQAGADNAQTWFATNEAGSGPYYLDEYEPNQTLVYKKFDDYWRGWDGKHVDEWVVKAVADPSTQLQMLQQGTADGASAITPDELNRLKNSESLQVKTYSGSPFYLMFNTDKGPTTKKEVREAISLVIDAETMNDTVMHGMAGPLNGPLPDWLLKNPTSSSPDRDMDRAKELIAKAGYGPNNPVKLEFLYFSGWSWEETVATVLQSELKKIDVELTITGAPWASFVQQASDKTTRPDMGAAAVFVPTPSPGPVLEASFSPVSEGLWTYWGYSNPQFTKALTGAQAASPAESDQFYQEATQILVDDFAAIWLMNMPDSFVLQNSVQNWTYDPAWGQIPGYYNVYKEAKA